MDYLTLCNYLIDTESLLPGLCCDTEKLEHLVYAENVREDMEEENKSAMKNVEEMMTQ